MNLSLDWLSCSLAVTAYLITSKLSNSVAAKRILIRLLIRFCVQVQKTSKHEELKNKPLKFIKQPFPKGIKEIKELTQEINKDHNLKLSGCCRDVSLIIECLFDDRGELLVDSMDNIVISKMGVAILVFEIEKSPSDELYDISIIIDIVTLYKENVLQLRSTVALVVSFLTFLATGSDYFRRFLRC